MEIFADVLYVTVWSLPQRLSLEVGGRVRPAAGQLWGDGQEDAEAALLAELNLGGDGSEGHKSGLLVSDVGTGIG